MSKYVVKSYREDGIYRTNKPNWTTIDHRGFDTLEDANKFIDERKASVDFELKFSIWERKEDGTGFIVLQDEREVKI